MPIPKISFKFTSVVLLGTFVTGASYADIIPELTLADSIKVPSNFYSTSAPSILKMSVKTVIEAGNNCIVGDYKACTFQDVLNDTNSDDDFKPEVKVIFSADDFTSTASSANAKIRQRGGHTRFLPLKSFRIKLDSKKELWRNQRRIQLVKSFDDATKIRNKLSYDLFSEIPHLPSMRTQFVQLNLQNAASPAPNTGPNTSPNMGLFTHIEHGGKEYIKSRGWKKDSRLYKAEHFTFSQQSDLALDANGKPLDKKKFEVILEIKSGKNHQKLNQMLAAVNDSSLDFKKDIFDKYFDQNNYLTWLAVNILVNNADTSNHNFYLYNPKGTDKFYFIPWDYDYAWGAHLDGTGGLTPNDMPPWWYSYAYRWDDNLHKQFLQQDGNRTLLRQAVTEIKNKYLTREKIKAKIDLYRSITEPLVTAKPDDFYDIYEDDAQKVKNYNAVLNKLIDNVELNYSRFISSFDNPMPFYAYNPEITANATQTQTKTVRFDWDDSISIQGNTVSYDLVLYKSKSEVIPEPDPGAPTHVIVPGNVVEVKTDIEDSDFLLNWVHPAGTYFYKVIARDSTKPKLLWQVPYDEAVKDVNGFPIHGVVKFEVTKSGVGTIPVVNNVAPIAYSQSVAALPKNTSTEISLIASDVVERSKMTATITTQPSKGTLTLNATAMTVSYTPNLDATGIDTFKFKVNDGLVDSSQATVSLLINEAPVAQDKVRAAVKKNTKIDLNLGSQVNDADGDTLSLLISQKPKHGVLSAVSGLMLSYTPNKHYAGSDSFIYRVKDVNGLYSNKAKVTLTMLNKVPTVSNQAIKLIQDTKAEFSLIAKDLDNDTLAVTITQKPAHGSLKLGTGLAVTYTPSKNYVGTDSFKYKVNDASVDSNEATVKLTMTKKVATTTPQKSSGGGSTSWFLLLLAAYGLRSRR